MKRTAFVPYSTIQMFDLVNDIEQYPLFLPWCPKAQIIQRANENEIQATLHFSKGILGKSFTTVNRLLPHNKIEMRLVQGPFRHLEGVWEFHPLKEGSQITLNIAFEFNNKLLTLTLGPLFNQIASTMVESFTRRAHQIYTNIENSAPTLSSLPYTDE